MLHETDYPSPSHNWAVYFEANANREERIPFAAHPHIALRPELHRALIRTLQRFHLGENGDGIWLKRFAAQTQDPDYCHACNLFVVEEQTHSRWFGLLLDRLGAPRLQKHWSDFLCTTMRHSGGLHHELITFLSAEIVSHKFFALLARNFPDELCVTVFSQLVRDESAHIAFHVGTLQRAFAGQNHLQRCMWHWRWKAMLFCSISIVCLDQAAIFRELRLSRREFAARCFDTFNALCKRIWEKDESAENEALHPKLSPHQ